MKKMVLNHEQHLFLLVQPREVKQILPRPVLAWNNTAIRQELLPELGQLSLLVARDNRSKPAKSDRIEEVRFFGA